MKKIILLVLSTLMFLSSCSVQSIVNKQEQSAVSERVDENYYVIGGDMLLDREDPGHQKIIAKLEGEESSSGTRALQEFICPLWPNGNIPYFFEPNFPAADKKDIHKAMRILETTCNVNFYESIPYPDEDYKLKIRKFTHPVYAGQCTLGYAKHPVFDYQSGGYGIVLHELGHCLGLAHEHQRPDRDEYINVIYANIPEDIRKWYDPLIMGNTLNTEYDYDSIMHYGQYLLGKLVIYPIKYIGNAVIGQHDHLSYWDKVALRGLYGEAEYGDPEIIWIKEGDFNGDGKTDIVKIWDNDGRMCADVQLKSGLAYSGSIMENWATFQGDIWGSQKWYVGNFDGDAQGKDDIMKIWNNNGKMCADVHLSTGSGFVMQRWATNQGGMWDSQQWFVADFTGDKKTDLVKIWNENGKMCADIHMSRNNRFEMKRWATNQGGMWDSQQWFAADFDGNGMTDLCKVFNEFNPPTGSDKISIDVHLSNGSAFSMSRWITRQGDPYTGDKWFVGNFNGSDNDGKNRADLCRVWKRYSYGRFQMCADVYVANRRYYSSFYAIDSFYMQRWATDQGNVWDLQEWHVGDFNGDGRMDIMKMWPENDLWTADVHLSQTSYSPYSIIGSIKFISQNKFIMERWATKVGVMYYSDNHGFEHQWYVVADFDGNGRDDLMRYAMAKKPEATSVSPYSSPRSIIAKAKIASSYHNSFSEMSWIDKAW